MCSRNDKNHHHGFTLFELLAVVMLLSILTFISVNMFNSVKARNHLSETDDRIKLITAKIKQYYDTHGQLPAAAGAGADEVPVQVDALDMEQKYRLDAWGRYMIYNPGDVTNIQDVGGVAASISSGGPDQDTTSINDNLTVSINVTPEAIIITQRKLKLLQEKVAAYDALFAGVDNDGDGEVDNVLDVGAAAVLTGVAPAFDFNTRPPTNSFSNDPSEGLSTLDAIEDGTGAGNYNCLAPLIDHIVAFYELPSGFPGGFDFDPWNRQFQWGYDGRLLDDGTPMTTSDRRYHRFFSSGPDNTDNQDDITVTGE